MPIRLLLEHESRLYANRRHGYACSATPDDENLMVC
jgi:hypothetical protein